MNTRGSKRVIFHNPGHVAHKGWVDDNGKAWDVPSRVDRLVETLARDSGAATEWVYVTEARSSTIGLVRAVHTPGLIEAIQEAGRAATEDHPVKSSHDRDEKTNASAVHPGTFKQALLSIECVVSAAELLLSGDPRTILVLSRPGGHHAGRDFHHGFGYFNTVGIAAHYLKEAGVVATLDFDAHHGDGTQDIFYEDPDVLCISLHADPDKVLPHTGREHENGKGSGLGATLNLPFPIGVTSEEYFGLLDAACHKIRSFKPKHLVVAAGFDAHMNDHIGLPPLTYLGDGEYRRIGEMIASLGIGTLHILSGGYNQEVTSNALLAYLAGVEATGSA